MKFEDHEAFHGGGSTIYPEFYPTPPDLARRAFSLLRRGERRITRLLEPSAGRGDLLAPVLESDMYRDRWFGPEFGIDCIEANLDHQAVLREKGLRVIDGDFLAHGGRGAIYSHILMNPPFSAGAEHVLKAWEMLYDGVLVAILNAATVRAPSTRTKQHLATLIAQHGTVEFVPGSFTDPIAARTTNVEVALIRMEKHGDVVRDWFTALDKDAGPDTSDLREPGQTLVIKDGTIRNAVRLFDAAVDRMKTATIAGAEADYFRRLLGDALIEDTRASASVSSISEAVNKGYAEIKEAAWRAVLEATEFRSQLSSAARERLDAAFEDVVSLEFTAANIYGLLHGLVAQKGEMQAEMVRDCFDLITKYGADNRVHYMGWKSNDKHKTMAYRVKMTRFVLPMVGWNQQFDYVVPWGWRDICADFDKVFAMLDGKSERSYQPGPNGEPPDMIGLDALFKDSLAALKTSERMQTEYFDVRFYKGIGTVHFYPRRKDLIERMNLMVGRMRQWIPQDEDAGAGRFWLQYNSAEKVQTTMDRLAKQGKYARETGWRRQLTEDGLSACHADACAKLKIPLPQIGHDCKSREELLVLTAPRAAAGQQ
jgi:hypothetical protein